MSQITRTVGPIHFEDYSGFQFERLVFAYHLRTESWETLEWLGEAGSDRGRDILGVLKGKAPKSLCVLCANWRKLTFAKASSDLKKACKAIKGKKKEFRVVAGHAVSDQLREKIKKFAREHGVQRCEVWSGAEFEERVRSKCEALLRRFCGGVEFPDAPEDLKTFGLENLPDDEILKRLARVLDRPAFTTPFHCESSLPDFKQAIGDTIEALNTGVWRTRDHMVIQSLPTRHDLAAAAKRDALARVECLLVGLRGDFEELVKSGDIRSDGCGVATCFVHILTPRAIQTMNARRGEILAVFRSAYPPFSASIGQLGPMNPPYPGTELAVQPGSLGPPMDRSRRIEKLPLSPNP